jgi:hypothetical protein
MKKIIRGLFFLSTLGLLIWSCGHKDLPEPEVDLGLEQDYITILNDLNTIQSSVDSAHIHKNNQGTCANYIQVYDTTGGVFGKFTLNFPASTCADTLTRKGSLEVYHRGGYAEGTLIDTIVFSNFSLSGRSMYGYRFRQVDSSNAQLKVFSIFDSIRFVFPSGKEYLLLSNTIRTDDNAQKTTSITGSSRAHVTNGDQFSVGISNSTNGQITHLSSFPILLDWSCTDATRFRYPVSGAFTFTNITRNIIRTINFQKGIQTGLPKDKTVTWLPDSCGRNTATFVSPLGNLYSFPVK